MKNFINLTGVAALILTASLAAVAQKPVISEKNVRAEMGFLASDAMQGRGSGTGYERIAAEYIGSQFMQFGLEPAGEAGWDGKPTYVQTVTITRNTFVEAPTLKYSDKTLVHGKEMLILRTNTASASGGAQRLAAGETPRAGATAIIRARDGTTRHLPPK